MVDWPKHPDGSEKMFVELTDSEKRTAPVYRRLIREIVLFVVEYWRSRGARRALREHPEYIPIWNEHQGQREIARKKALAFHGTEAYQRLSPKAKLLNDLIAGIADPKSSGV
jgi:hypothetical protein